MRYREYAPAPALAGLVHRFWTLEGSTPEVEFQRAMPDGRPELIFNLADPFERRRPDGTEVQPRALLVGPTTRALLVRPTGRVDLVGVRLQPGPWPALLDLDAAELLDRAVALRDAARHWRADLLEPLAETKGAAARLALLERRLLRESGRQARGDRRRERRLSAAVELTLAARGRLSVSRVAELTGTSERNLTRLFRAGTGMSPRLLGRLARFQQVLGALERPVPVRWAALAYRHGYCDQAHLCREFRRFGGLSPGRYLAAARDVTRHFVEQT